MLTILWVFVLQLGRSMSPRFLRPEYDVDITIYASINVKMVNVSLYVCFEEILTVLKIQKSNLYNILFVAQHPSLTLDHITQNKC